MTRDDLYGYYRRYYVPNNATLVIVGDVDTDAALRRVEHSLRRHPAGRDRSSVCAPSSRSRPDERRLTIRQEGTTAYLKVGLSRAVGRPTTRFCPLLILDAVLDRRQGAEPVVQFPHAAAAAERAPLSRARRARARVVGVRVARCRPSSRSRTSLSATATEGTPLAGVEAALLEELDRVRARRHHRRRAGQSQGAAAGRGSCSTTTA